METERIESWDTLWAKLSSDKAIIEEYRMAFLLNLFQKICSKMEHDIEYKKRVNKLFLQSYSKLDTTKEIVCKATNVLLPNDDIQIIERWFEAYRKKSTTRKTISPSVKTELFEKQNGKCEVCGIELGDDWKKIHVDHIIPWKLVGDELDNNYQLLCNTCNECKSAKTDYLFKNLINLV